MNSVSSEIVRQIAQELPRGKGKTKPWNCILGAGRGTALSMKIQGRSAEGVAQQVFDRLISDKNPLNGTELRWFSSAQLEALGNKLEAVDDAHKERLRTVLERAVLVAYTRKHSPQKQANIVSLLLKLFPKDVVQGHLIRTVVGDYPWYGQRIKAANDSPSLLDQKQKLEAIRRDANKEADPDLREWVIKEVYPHIVFVEKMLWRFGKQ